MNWGRESLKIAVFSLVFLFFYHFPDPERFQAAIGQGMLLLHDYARKHVIFCLVPAFYIAGAIEVFISGQLVMKYLGPRAPLPVAYGVAAVAGTILAVCSCTILPLFAGIYNMGAGLGPATTFLYSGPAVNVLAIILSARVLGLDIGLARAIGAISASVVVGITMSFIFRRSDHVRLSDMASQEPHQGASPLWHSIALMATLVLILIFSTWGKADAGLARRLFEAKWYLTTAMATLLGMELWAFYGVGASRLVSLAALVLFSWQLSPGPVVPYIAGIVGFSVIMFFTGGQAREWFESSYLLARQILPILFVGVFVAGFFLGSPGGGPGGIIAPKHVADLVGGNSLLSNLFASVVGALMYFATLTEIPILQGLMHLGMGKGPALALLLAGPAVSLPNMLVIRSVMGTMRTAVYVVLVVVFATISGMIFGAIMA